MSRHSASHQERMLVVYDHPLPEHYLQTVRFQPAYIQCPNVSYTSTPSSSRSSNPGSFMLPSAAQHDCYDVKHSAYTRERHNNHVSIHASDVCISPLELEAPSHHGSRRNCDSQRIVPSSDSRHIVDYDEAHARAVIHQSAQHHQEDSGSSGTEKDSSKRVACKWDGCNATFSRKADVNRHASSTHDVKLIDCDVKNCSRKGENGFTRKDHLLEHKRGYHCMDVPKRYIKSSSGRHER